MAEVKTYRCDAEGCSQMKAETNHWLRIRIAEGGGFDVRPWEGGLPAVVGVDEESGDEMFFLDEEARVEAVKRGFSVQSVKELHLCSDSCVVKVLQQWLGRLKRAGEAGDAVEP